MTIKIIGRIFLTWLLFTPLAILNGIARNSLYQPIIGELAAHQVSTVIGSLAFIALAYVMMHKQFAGMETKTLVAIGATWVLMTITFEFLFGHYVAGHSWQKLFYDYNIFAGRIWALFLLVSGLTPLIVRGLANRK